MHRNKIVAGVGIFVILAGGFVIQSFASGEKSEIIESYEITTVPETVVETTTTIDWSFLTTTTTVYVAPKPKTEPVYVDGDTVWDDLAYCESRGNWAANTGNGFGGGLQFMHQRSYSTWNSFGGKEFAENPWEASREEQIVIAERVLDSSGWGAWPACSRKLGLR